MAWGQLDRLLAGAVLTVTLVVVTVVTLAGVGVLTTPALLAVFAATAVLIAVVVWRRRPRWRPQLPSAVSAQTAPVLLVAVFALALAVVAAYYLPVWQWDALGYHLPYVNLILQRGSFANVPADVPYLSTYPHTVEWVFTAWRAMLPDDRLVELGHLPFGLLGALAIATIACGQGARLDHSVAAGAAWLTLPAVFLQLPTNYTDLAAAALLLTAIAFVLAPPDTGRVLLAGVSIGLFLGSKPQAPLAAAVLLVVLTVRAWRAGHRAAAVTAWVVAPALGGYTYAVNSIRFGNPVWPVRVDLGPIHLPGTRSMAELLNSGAAVPRTQGNVVARVVESWSTLVPPLPVFDMRIGGFGLLFLIALPFALVQAVRTRSPAVLLCFAATLVTPDPAVARYVLAFAGLTLAFAAPALAGDRLTGGARTAILAGVAIITAANLVIAYPGLTGEGPRLTAYPQLTLSQRQRAVGAHGSPAPYLDALARLPAGAVTVLDSGAELPYLAWPYDLSHTAVFLPDGIDGAAAERAIMAPDIAMLVVGDDTQAGAAARRHPEHFAPAFRCASGSCTVYLRT